MLNKLPPSVLIVCLCLLLVTPRLSQAQYVIYGEFDASSPTYDRTKSTDPLIQPECGIESEDSANDGVVYAQYKIVPSVSESIQAKILVNSTVDTMLAIYCNTFNPEDPGANLLAMDDDGNGYPHASLIDRTIPLVGGNTYYLVVANYSNYIPYGSYELEINDTAQHVHSLQDAIVALQVVGGLAPALSNLGHLSDISESGKITLGTAITVLREIMSGL